MGNRCSNQTETIENKCFLCLEQIKSYIMVRCIRCNIYLHGHCDVKYKNHQNYNKCPQCQQIGTMCIETNSRYVYS